MIIYFCHKEQGQYHNCLNSIRVIDILCRIYFTLPTSPLLVTLCAMKDSINRPIQILMIAPTSFFSDYGGHIRIYEETLALQALGHHVTIVTYYKGRNLHGLDIRRTPPLPYRTDYEVGSSRHKVAFDLYLALKSFQVAWQLRPDIIHGHMHEGALIGGVLARALRIPLVFDFQGSLSAEMVDHNFLKRNTLLYRAVRRLEQSICHLPQMTLTSSLQAKNTLQTQFAVPPTQLLPLPDCVDLHRFDPTRFDSAEKAALKQQLRIPPTATVITYLGLLTEYQGIHHLLYAASILKQWQKNAHFLIMGYPNVEQFRERAHALGVDDCVTFTGKIHYDDAPRYLALGDISVSAKISATEGSGKLLNYMALGQPVVAYDTPVHREYLAEHGIYPSCGNMDQFALDLAKLIDQPDQQKQLGRLLQERARHHYSWQKSAEKISDLYYQLINRPN